jgi:hypothetical protein
MRLKQCFLAAAADGECLETLNMTQHLCWLHAKAGSLPTTTQVPTTAHTSRVSQVYQQRPSRAQADRCNNAACMLPAAAAVHVRPCRRPLLKARPLLATLRTMLRAAHLRSSRSRKCTPRLHPRPTPCCSTHRYSTLAQAAVHTQ